MRHETTSPTHELALDADDARGQERGVLGNEGLGRPFVKHKAAGGAEMVCNPLLAGMQDGGGGTKMGADELASGQTGEHVPALTTRMR